MLCNINLITFEYFCLSKRALFTGEMLPPAGCQVNCRFESVGRNQLHKLVFFLFWILMFGYKADVCIFFHLYLKPTFTSVKETLKKLFPDLEIGRKHLDCVRDYKFQIYIYKYKIF